MTEEEKFAYIAPLVDYDPETGIFTWRRREGDDKGTKVFNTLYAGKVAGSADRDGYRQVTTKVHGVCTTKLLHRLAWYISHGRVPPDCIDHINRVRDDNRMCNLREATRQENQRNMGKRSDNVSGVSGVNWHKKCRKWRAVVWVGGKPRHIGLFTDISDAEAAVKAFRAQHGFSDTHGE